MVPLYDNKDTTKMVEGEMYAIETFGSTGKGKIEERGECSHYMKDWDCGPRPLRHGGAKKLLSFINKRFDTLTFCRRSLGRRWRAAGKPARWRGAGCGQRPWRGGGRWRGGRWQTWLSGVVVGGGDAGTVRTGVGSW